MAEVEIRCLAADDLDAADRIVRLAFGTFLGLPDPASFMGDADYAHGRWASEACASWAAELDGELAGSNFATRWGSVGFFGPITVLPDLWDRKIAQRLLEPTMEQFAAWGTTHEGLFTFPQSAKHVNLYQKFDFWPRFLTAVAAKPVAAVPSVAAAGDAAPWARLSALSDVQRETALADCRAVCETLYDGLDLSAEIRATASQHLGDTVLLLSGDRVDGFAVCHTGAGSEAGSGRCYMKFGAVRSGPGAASLFDGLLDACEAFAAESGARTLIGGANMARLTAYQAMQAHGFRTETQGVVMQRRHEIGYNRPDVFAIDDWR